VLSAGGAQAGLLLLPVAGNIALSALFALQYATGCIALAAQLTSARYALLFSAYSFLALASAACVQAVGTAASISTNGFYFISAVMQMLVGLTMPLIAVLTLVRFGMFTSKREVEDPATGRSPLFGPPGREETLNSD